MGIKTFQARGVGPELSAVLPENAPPWYKQRHLIRLNFTIFSMILFTSANGYDGSMMLYPNGSWLGFINAVQSLGALCLFPLVAWSNNRFGRKKTIAVGYFWLALGVGLGAGARNPAMFVLGRLFIGGTSAFFSASAPILITETAYPTHRSIATALCNCGWYVGSLLAAWVTYGTRNSANNWSWRVPTLVQIVLPILISVGFLMAEESPRWLASKGRVEEARSFLVRCHAGGDESSPLVEFELEEIVSTIALERQLREETSWLDLVRTTGNRRRTLISVSLGIFAQWNGVGIVSYYLAPVLKTVGVTSVTNQTMISGFLQVWNLILAVSAAFSVDTLGRRKLFLTSCVGMLCSYIIISGLSGSFAHTGLAATGIAVIPFLFIFYGFLTAHIVMASLNLTSPPTLRWGIIATGLISSWFVADLLLPRSDAKATHILQAVGSSSLEKSKAFVQKKAPKASPAVYGSYAEVYADPEVDIVYIGTPHAFHKQNCLDAIAAGKHVLCEKAFTITAEETQEVLSAAHAKGVFIMEAMWTRFHPLVLSLRKMLHEEKIIGDVRRTFCDFGLDMNIAALGPESRLKNPALGAGTLLDIGIYSLTWGLLSLDAGNGETAEEPKIVATQTLSHSIDIASSFILHYPKTGRQGILTSTTEIKSDPVFCRIEGSKGYITVEGPAASVPTSFTVFAKNEGSATGDVAGEVKVAKGETHTLEKPGMGFYWEADAVALDIAAGRTENAIMPHAETLRVMEMLDEIRRQGGARFPQDMN